MKVQLVVSEWCKSCHVAERIWRGVAEERAIEFEVVDMGQPEGKALATAQRLRSIPAVLVDGELKGVGVQTREEALQMVAQAPPRAAGATRHIGLGMERSSRIAVLSAVAYLMLAGLALPLQGGLIGEGYGRAAALHVYTLGFVVFMVYGLGEHMLPRFTGNPIRLGAWPWAQMTLAHGGVLAMATGLHAQRPALAALGGMAAWLAFALFLVRIWPVLWPPAAAQREPIPEEETILRP